MHSAYGISFASMLLRHIAGHLLAYSNITQHMPWTPLKSMSLRACFLFLPTQITSLTSSAGGSSDGGVATDRVLLPSIAVGSKLGRSSGAQLTRPSSGGTLFSWGLKEWRLARNKGAWCTGQCCRLPGGGEQADGSGLEYTLVSSTVAGQGPAGCAVRLANGCKHRVSVRVAR